MSKKTRKVIIGKSTPDETCRYCDMFAVDLIRPRRGSCYAKVVTREQAPVRGAVTSVGVDDTCPLWQNTTREELA